MSSKARRVVHHGTEFIWDGSRWFDAKAFVIPPDSVIYELNALIREALVVEDAGITKTQELIKRAQGARDNGQFERARALLYRVLSDHPKHAGALAVLSSALREQNAPERALAETERFKNAGYAPLYTSRAAAMCDLGMWEEAKKEVGRALAIGVSDENRRAAFTVVDRIKGVRPDLYDR